METGSNKSLLTLLAVVIFGVFLSLSYWMFQDELTNILGSVMESAGLSIGNKADLLDDYITYGYNLYNTTTATFTNKEQQSVTFSSIGVNFWGDGLEFDAKYLDSNKNYVLSYDITKESGSITKIGGHNLLGAVTMKLDDVVYNNTTAINYPNDNLKHHVEVVFNTNNLVKDGENVYISGLPNQHAYYYIQPNRGVSTVLTYKVKLENLSIKEVN
jgi:hypothetical protein